MIFYDKEQSKSQNSKLMSEGREEMSFGNMLSINYSPELPIEFVFPLDSPINTGELLQEYVSCSTFLLSGDNI